MTLTFDQILLLVLVLLVAYAVLNLPARDLWGKLFKRRHTFFGAAPPPPQPAGRHGCAQLYLSRGDGFVEHEVAWHQSDFPPETLLYHGRTYKRVSRALSPHGEVTWTYLR